MTRPSPAIVAQGAVERLPRYSLWLLTLAYVLPGFWLRQAWPMADLADFQRMQALANADLWPIGPSTLWSDVLGAAAIRWLTPLGLTALGASRWPFIVLLGLTLAATWYAVYYLARDRDVQPVSFAFGGEASPRDYARTVADGGFLALLATLGLAQLSHETTALSLQLACSACMFLGFAQAPYKRLTSLVYIVIGLLGLAGSGAPGMALMLGLAGLLTTLRAAVTEGAQIDTPASMPSKVVWWAVIAAVLAVIVWRHGATLQSLLIAPWPAHAWGGLLRLFIWFTWPAWPLALWTLWQWRLHLGSRAIAWPLTVFSLVSAKALVVPDARAEFALLSGLPALAALATFALPTFRRSWSAFIDWFTLIFFSGCALVIWGLWIAQHTGWPARLQKMVASWVPGFVPVVYVAPIVLALLGTLAWAVLVRWRTQQLRPQMWKTLVLPATGAVLCWLLLTTLWLPALNHVYAAR